MQDVRDNKSPEHAAIWWVKAPLVVAIFVFCPNKNVVLWVGDQVSHFYISRLTASQFLKLSALCQYEITFPVEGITLRPIKPIKSNLMLHLTKQSRSIRLKRS